MLTFLFTCSITAIFLVYHFSTSKISQNGRQLPRPPGTLPLAGYGIWFLQPRHKLLDWFAEIQPQMGFATYEIPVPSLPPAVLINDPKNLEYVLKNIDLFVKGDFFQSRSWDLFAQGILNSDGELWRIQRKAGLRFLINSNLQHFIDDVLPPMFETTAKRLDEAAKNNSIIDLQQEMLDLTTRFFGKVAYDMSIDPSMPFSKAFDHASAVTNSRFTNPFWRLHTILFGRSFRASCAEVHSFGASMVENAKATLSTSKGPSVTASTPSNSSSSMSADQVNEPPPQTAPNLITSLLNHIDDPTVVASAATNYLSAGRDTTAQSLAWTFHALISHSSSIPPLLSALDRHKISLTKKSEHRNQANSTSISLAYADLSPTPNAALLPFHAAFHESLRLSPAVPFEIKETTAPAQLPDGTQLPAGAAVIWIPYASARNPLIWGDDAKMFKPKRWLVMNEAGEEELVVKSPFEHPVFNAGPRMCVGKRMAECVGVWVLARVLWEWDLREVDKDGKPWKGGWQGRKVGESLTAPMAGGLPVKVKRRNR